MSASPNLYDSRIHAEYYRPERRSSVPDRYRDIVELVRSSHPGPIHRALEVGSETPIIPTFWSGRLGISTSDVRLTEVSSRSAQLLRDAGFQVELCDASVDALPFPSESFTLVILSEVLEHLRDPDHALEECRRVLAPGGLLVLTTPNLACWFNRFGLLAGWQPLFTETGSEWVFGRGPLIPTSRPVGHLQVFTVGAVRALLEYHGFAALRIRGLRMETQQTPTRAAATLDGFFARFPTLASGLLVAATVRKDR